MIYDLMCFAPRVALVLWICLMVAGPTFAAIHDDGSGGVGGGGAPRVMIDGHEYILITNPEGYQLEEDMIAEDGTLIRRIVAAFDKNGAPTKTVGKDGEEEDFVGPFDPEVFKKILDGEREIQDEHSYLPLQSQLGEDIIVEDLAAGPPEISSASEQVIRSPA